MDLGVLLESPQGSQSSSQVGLCTCAFLSSGYRYIGELLSCNKGVKDPLEVPDFKGDYRLVASVEMGLI